MNDVSVQSIVQLQELLLKQIETSAELSAELVQVRAGQHELSVVVAEVILALRDLLPDFEASLRERLSQRLAKLPDGEDHPESPSIL